MESARIHLILIFFFNIMLTSFNMGVEMGVEILIDL